MHALVFALLFAAPDPAPAPVPAPAPDDGPPPVEVSATLTPDNAAVGSDNAAVGSDNAAVGSGATPAHDPNRPLEVTLGEPLVLTLTARAARDTTLFPPLTPALGSFEVARPLEGSEKAEGAGKTVTWRWRVLPLRLGVEKLPAIELPYRTIDGREGAASTAMQRVMIRGLLENDNDPALGKAPDPVDVIGTNWALVWGLSVGGAIVFAALATWLVLLALRQRFEALRPSPPPRPANEVALERLDRIDQSSGAELDGAQRLARTIDALREYLAGRYRIDALEMTSPELVRALPDLDLKTVPAAEIEGLLADADLVKFARLMPAESDARGASPIVRRIVTETWEAPKEDKPEVIRREAASVRQRVYAGLVDGLMAGVLGLMLMGFLWVVGAIELGFLALLLVGVLASLRDAFGRSPGKQLLRLDVVVRDELQSRPSFASRLKRNALFLVWPLTAPLEWLVLRQHPLALRVGDIWADTEVVRAEAAPAPREARA